MRIADIMTPNPKVLPHDSVLRDAARQMRDLDVGMLPISKDDRLVGMLTDRDITVRATAEGRDPINTKVSEVMTPDALYCFEAPRCFGSSENDAGNSGSAPHHLGPKYLRAFFPD